MQSLKGKSVLVTGGAGFIGSHLVDRIIHENPAKLTIVDNFFLGSEENLQDAKLDFSNLRIYRLDASSLSAMYEVVTREGIEIVFNLAVIPLPTSLHFPHWTIETNLGITTTFCEIARMGLIKTLVHCSSSEAYGTALYSPMDENHPLEPSTPYAASKASGDFTVLSYRKTFGIDTVIVRPFNNFGPRQNAGSYAGIIPIVVNRVDKGLPVEIFGDGLQTRDYIFVRDTVEAIVKVFESDATRGKVINIASGYEISINELVTEMLHLMNIPNYSIIHTNPRDGDIRRHCGGVQLLQELTDYKPRPIVEDSLKETVNWYTEKR